MSRDKERIALEARQYLRPIGNKPYGIFFKELRARGGVSVTTGEAAELYHRVEPGVYVIVLHRTLKRLCLQSMVIMLSHAWQNIVVLEIQIRGHVHVHVQNVCHPASIIAGCDIANDGFSNVLLSTQLSKKHRTTNNKLQCFPSSIGLKWFLRTTHYAVQKPTHPTVRGTGQFQGRWFS